MITKTPISRDKLRILSSSQTVFLNELKNIKQAHINNGFPNYIVDTALKYFINKTEQHNINNTLNHKQSIYLYYEKQFHSTSNIDEHHHHHHHHHVALVARISLTLSLHTSLSFIAPGRSSGQHPVSSHSC